jgi:MSHA biogenesis protein MshI
MLIMKIPFLAKLLKRTKRSGPACVLTFGNNGINFAQTDFVAGRPRLVNYSFHPVAGMNLSGITPAALEKICKEKRLNDFKFSTLLAAGEYQLMQVEAPNVPESEMKAAIRWSIKDLLSYHVDDATLDVLFIPTSQPGNERAKLLYVVAASNELIKKRTELFENAHIALRVIDIPEMAQRNVAALFEKKDRALALLAFDVSGCLLTFTSGGEVYMARRIEISPGQLQDADESMRQQYLDRLELELQRSIDHFDRQFKHLPVQRLLVSVPRNIGLVEILSNNLDLPVAQLDLGEVMDLGSMPDLAGDEAMVYALHTLGASLRQEGKTS